MIFLCDSIDPKREAERTRLLEKRNRLRAQLIGDADKETKDEIEEIERRLKLLDQPRQ